VRDFHWILSSVYGRITKWSRGAHLRRKEVRPMMKKWIRYIVCLILLLLLFAACAVKVK